MKIRKTVYTSNTNDTDYYRICIGNSVKTFPYSEKHLIGKYIQNQWKNYAISPAYIYGDSDWNLQNMLLYKYELIIEDMNDFDSMEKW